MATTKYDIQLNLITKGLEQITKVTDSIKNIKLPETFKTNLNDFEINFNKNISKIKSNLEEGLVSDTGLSALEKRMSKMVEDIARYTEKPISDAVKQLTKELDKLQERRDRLMSESDSSRAAAQTARDFDIKGRYGLSKQAPVSPEAMDKQLLSIEKKINAAKLESDRKLNEEKKKNFLEYMAAYRSNQQSILDLEAKASEKLGAAGQVQKEIDAISVKIKEMPHDLDPTTREFKEMLDWIREIRSEMAKVQTEEIATSSAEQIKETAKNLQDLNEVEEKHKKTLGQKLIQSFSYYTIFSKLKQLYNDMIRTITDLDIAMTDITVVTVMNRQEAWNLLGTYQDLAKQVGLTTSEVARLSTEFFKQGRNLKDSLELTKVAAKSALVASIDVNEAADYLTSAVNGFGLAADMAVDVADKMALLSAASATDFEEIAIALSKVSPVAQSAGVDLDWMMGVLAMGLETTREAPENIGTAFKTIFARMRELTDIGKATEDGMSLNRVEKALLSIDVPLRAAEGGFRNLDEVLTEVGRKWKDLDSYQQAYLATAIAGSRQQPRLMAVFNDFERTEELIEASKESQNALEYQHMSYMGGMQAATTNLKTAWEGIITAFSDSEVIISVFRTITGILEGVASVLSSLNNPVVLFTSSLLILMAVTKRYGATMTAWIQLQVEDIALKIKRKALTLQQAAAEAYASSVTAAGTVTSLTAAKADIAGSAAKLGLAGAAGVAGAAIKGFAVSVNSALGPIGWAIIAITAVTAAITGIVKSLQKANPSLEQMNKQIKENNKLMYDNRTRSKDLTAVVDEYRELANQVYKSNEELERMAALLDQLKNYDSENELSFAFEIAGKTIFDENSYNQYISKLEQENEKTLTENIESLRKSIKRFGLNKTMEMKEMKETFYQIGGGLVEELVRGFEDSDISNKVTDAMAQTITKISPENFLKVRVKGYKNDWDKSFNANGQFVKDIIGTEEEIQAELQRLREAGYKMRYSTGISPDHGGDMWNAYAQDPTRAINEDEYAKIIEFQTSLYENMFTDIANINEKYDKQSSTSIQERIDVYNNAIEEIKKQGHQESLTNQLIDSLTSSDNIGYALNELRKKGIGNDVLAALMNTGLNANQIDQMFENISKYSTQNPSNVLAAILGADENTMKNAMDQLKNIVPVEHWSKVTSEINKVMVQSASSIGDSISSIGDHATKLSSLFEEMSTGDFSNFDLLADIYSDNDSIENFEKFMAGEKTIADLLGEQYKTEIDKAKVQAALLESQAREGEELSKQQQIELRKYKMIIANERTINEQLFERIYLTSEIEKSTKKIADNQSLVSELLDVGFEEDSSFIKFFKELSNYESNNVINNISSQLDSMEGSFMRVSQEMVDAGLLVDGKLNVLGKTLTVEQKALVESYKTLTEELKDNFDNYLDYINNQAKAIEEVYKKQTEAIEDRYDRESEALQKAHDARWSEIDYTNKLIELQDKVVAARNKLIGTTLDGSSKASVDAAKNTLRELQLERQKVIEDEMMRKAEEELAKKRDEALAQIEIEQTEAINKLSEDLKTWGNALVENTKALQKRAEVTVAPSSASPTSTKRSGGGSGGSARDLMALAYMTDTIV